MTELAADPQQAESRPPDAPDKLNAPRLYLSSKPAGWGGLVAEAFYEPMELHGWTPPATSDITLILFAGGPLCLDRRYEDGLKTTCIIHEGELVLRPDVLATSEVSWISQTSIPTRTLHLHLSRDLLSRTAEDLAGYDPARLSLTRLDSLQDGLLMQIGFALWRELEQPAPAGKLYAQTAAQMMAVHLLRNYMAEPLRIKELSQVLTRRQIQRVTDFVLADLRRDLSLEALAECAGFSPYHFARLFRQTTGESPHQFVLRKRIKKAQHLLSQSNVSLAEVAFKSGFANQSHMTHVFKRDLGLTPRAYRQEFQTAARFCNDSQD